jgi:hypothetical protein
LRKAAARRLAEAGCTALQNFGDTAAADQERMARDAMKRIGDD